MIDDDILHPTPAVQAQILWLYVDAGIAQGKLGNWRATLATSQEGRQWVQTHVADPIPAVQAQILQLYVNTGVAQGKLGDPKASLATHQEGLQWARTHGTDPTPAVQARILRLYRNAGSTQGQLGQSGSALRSIPLLNLLAWALATIADLKEGEGNDWQITVTHLENARQKLEPEASVLVKHCQRLLQFFLNPALQPPAPHLPFVIPPAYFPTADQRLRLSEGFYVLEWAQHHQSLLEAYQSLQGATHPAEVERWRKEIGDPLRQQLRELQPLWQTLFPNSASHHPLTPSSTEAGEQNQEEDGTLTLDTLRTARAELQNLSRWQRFKHRRSVRAIKARLPTLDRLYQADQKYKYDWDTRYGWERHLREARRALVDGLSTPLVTRYSLPPGLSEPLFIALAALLPYEATEATRAVAVWQEQPPWAEKTRFRSALQGSRLLEWAQGHRPLYDFYADRPLDIRFKIHRAGVPSEDAQKVLRELLATWEQEPTLHARYIDGNWQEELCPPPLQRALQMAWEVVQERAKPLARLLTALADPTFTRPLDEVGDPEPGAYTQALTAWLQGKAVDVLKEALSEWLEQQGKATGLVDIDSANHSLECQFEAAIRVAPRWQSDWEAICHDLAKQRLSELLSESPLNLETIWQTLERSRVALAGLTAQTSLEHWYNTLEQPLREAFEQTQEKLNARSENPNVAYSAQEWPPLVAWLEALKNWLPALPTVDQCQAHLRPQEALIQPFFDATQQRLRILWLDAQGLQLRELPAECAAQAQWFTPEGTGVVDQWVHSIQQDKQGVPDAATWPAVLNHPAVQSFVHTFRAWATAQNLTQLTVIFPAPLGQLPWEAQFDAFIDSHLFLVRAVSVAHWCQPTASSIQLNKSWVLGTTGLDKNLACANTEATWVAKQWGTPPHLPSAPVSIFTALQRLEASQAVCLSTHGRFEHRNPLKSGLFLGTLPTRSPQKSEVKLLPLWLCSVLRLPITQLVILSACETHVSGRDAEGLLSPVGIGPALAAAGARTIIGTLWSCSDSAALCFNYHLLTLADENPTQPWHELVARARQRLRSMTSTDIADLQTRLGMEEEGCLQTLDKRCEHPPPFAEPVDWAGFVLLGQSERVPVAL